MYIPVFSIFLFVNQLIKLSVFTFIQNCSLLDNISKESGSSTKNNKMSASKPKKNSKVGKYILGRTLGEGEKHQVDMKRINFDF